MAVRSLQEVMVNDWARNKSVVHLGAFVHMLITRNHSQIQDMHATMAQVTSESKWDCLEKCSHLQYGFLS